MQKITFTGALVRKGELKTSKRQGRDGTQYESKFMYITLVRNYRSYDSSSKEWKDEGSIFQECILSGKVAENFNKSNIKPGSRLVVTGELYFVPSNTYTNKEGIEVVNPERENVLVEDIGLSFMGWQIPEDTNSREGTVRESKPVQNIESDSFNDDLFSDLDDTIEDDSANDTDSGDSFFDDFDF